MVEDCKKKGKKSPPFAYQSPYSSQQAKVVPLMSGILDTPTSAGSLGSIRFLFTFRTPGKARSKPSRMASTSTSW